MRRIEPTPRFNRLLASFLDAHPNLEEKVFTVMKRLAQNPRDAKAHPLSGEMKGCYAASITLSYRIIFSLETDAIWFIAIGSHDDVY